ncbi:hypothetical protein SAY86_002135 [Trapa natans]|uniref:Uncharacterized protein n=1 Tax=Trapa natans TaxID=22666 RepID=A0AAN7R314_TRANT|nr:hypothetical protein SAY86_002135 [Trapa natans]
MSHHAQENSQAQVELPETGCSGDQQSPRDESCLSHLIEHLKSTVQDRALGVHLDEFVLEEGVGDGAGLGHLRMQLHPERQRPRIRSEREGCGQGRREETGAR